MAPIAQTKAATVDRLWQGIEAGLTKCSTLEQAAQKLVDAIYNYFEDGLAPARIFVTASYGSLPPSESVVCRELGEIERRGRGAFRDNARTIPGGDERRRAGLE